MGDVVVTVPKDLWPEWLEEGDRAHDMGSFVGIPAAWEGRSEYGFVLASRPSIEVGERVYIVARGRLRGYAPLTSIDGGERFGGARGSIALVRRGEAVGVTVDQPIRGFQGFRYRWWKRCEEKLFPLWTQS